MDGYSDRCDNHPFSFHRPCVCECWCKIIVRNTKSLIQAQRIERTSVRNRLRLGVTMGATGAREKGTGIIIRRARPRLTYSPLVVSDPSCHFF